MRYSFILLICLASMCHTFGQSLIRLDDNSPYSNIGKSVSYLEDKSNKLTLDSVKILDKKGSFINGNTDVLLLGNSMSSFWVKINYINVSKGKAFLIVDIPNIESIDLYTDVPEEGMLHLHTGSVAGKIKDVIAANNFIFDLQSSVANPPVQSIYLRVKTNNILILPLKLVTAETLIANVSIKTRVEAMYIGALIIMFFFNLFLYLSFKDHIYFIYSIYVGAMFVYIVFYIRGYSFLFGNDFRSFINLYPHAFLSIACIASGLFSANFLDLKKKLPKIIVFYNLLIASWVFIFVISALGFKSVISDAVNYLLTASSLFLWVVAIWSYRDGHKQALYYIFAWSFICIPIVFMTLTLLRVFDYHDYTFYMVPAGTTVELLLLSFALGDRFNTIRKQNMRLVTTQKERLEKLVQGRTIKLNESVEMLKVRTLKLNETIIALEETNAVKNKLFSIIAHDLRSPFNSLLSIFSLKDMNLLTFEDLKMLLNESRKSIDNIHNTLNNLLAWAKSQMEGAIASPSEFNLQDLVSDLILVYRPLIEKKSIRIDVVADQDLTVYADENQVQLIMRNLIDNAIKFTPFNQSIEIKMGKKARRINVCVANPVSGEGALNIKAFSSGGLQTPAYGTANEKGVGLGLHLCREYVIQNGGELTVNFDANLVSICFSLSCGDSRGMA